MRGHRRLLASGVLSVACLLMASQGAVADEQCTLTRLTQVDLTYDPSGGPLIPATINGQERSMLVDTGSIFSTVTEQTVDDLHLKTEEAPMRMFQLADGKSIDSSANVKEIIIGEMRGKDWPFLVIPRGEPGSDRWAGTVGPDVMGNYDVEFDFGAGKFALYSHDHCPGKVVYWTRDGYASLPVSLGRMDDHIRLTATLDGKPLNVLIDTGTSMSVMNFATAHELFGIAPNDPALINACPLCPAGSAERGAVRYPFKSLSFGGVTVLGPNINLYPDTLKGLGTDEEDQMIVGMTILKQLHLYLSYKEKTLYVTGANAH